MAQIPIKDGFATYPCGCKFEVLKTMPNVRLKFDQDINKLPLTCEATWNLLGEGNTKGVFQLESRFGQQYAKRLKPENIEQLAALTSILRPGCIQAMRDGKSVAEHYIDRKNGVEPVDIFHPALQPILGQTYGEMIYQEQAMKIAQDIAGFTLEQADILRKAIGKKKANIMAQVKQEFLTGCHNTGIVTQEEAEAIFSWIEKSQRYSFNKSHAVSYAYNAYLSAYLKAHFKHSFFASYLFFAKDKQDRFDEVKLLIANCKSMDVVVKQPDFRQDNIHFSNINNVIYFGLTDIKGVGTSSVNKMTNAIYSVETILQKERKDWFWIEFLLFFSQSVSSTVIEGLIEAGALDYFGVSRQRMLFEYEHFCKLTDKEQAWVKQHLKYYPEDRLSTILKLMLDWYDIKDQDPPMPKPCANKNRVVKIGDLLKVCNNPPYSLNDSPDWVARVEEARLGVSITASALDSCKNADAANCTCVEFSRGAEFSSGIFMAVQVDEIKETLTRNGDPMAFVTLNDTSGSLDAVVFPQEWPAIRQSGICVKENTIMVSGERSNKGTFIVKQIWQLS